MKFTDRYWLFATQDYGENGGIDDLKATSNSFEDLKNKIVWIDYPKGIFDKPLAPGYNYKFKIGKFEYLDSYHILDIVDNCIIEKYRGVIDEVFPILHEVTYEEVFSQYKKVNK